MPETYRRPLVLCELQGLNRKEAARELGLAAGTLSSRLARGRQMLRNRLARRGIAPALTAGLAVGVPAELAAATVSSAVAVLTRAAGTVPTAILSLTEGVVKAMFVKWKLAAIMVAACLGLSGLGAWHGSTGPAAASSADLPAKPTSAPAEAPRIPSPIPSGRTSEVVATIFGDEPITRDAFAEHLIRRYGKKELELFVNKQVIARAFGKKGWTISADEVQAALDADCKAIGVTRAHFVKDVLPRYSKTPTEWIEDVILPRLMMSRLCETKLAAPTDEELRQAFEAKHGEKVQCQIICWPKDQGDEARKVYERVRTSVAEFERYARQTSNPNLAASGGHMPPIPRTAPLSGGGDANNAATKLKTGEVSPLVATKDGFVVARCVGVIPADTTKSFDTEKPMLLADVAQVKINLAIPKLFDELKREANPKYHLTFPDPVVLPNPVPLWPKK